MTAQYSDETVVEANRISVTDLETGYGNSQIINEVSLQTHGDVTCIFGPNGSGKSTLLKCIAGSLPVWSGRIEFNGQDISSYDSHEVVSVGIVLLPQDGGIFPNLTVRENLRLGAHTVHDDDRIQARQEEVLEAFPVLKDKLTDDASSLSGGQQMMLGFGIAIMTGADVFMMDEPTAGLAPQLVVDMMEMIEEIVEREKTVILVEQNVSASLEIADHVYVLARGRVQFDGTPEELLDEDQLIDLYLGL